MSVVRVEVVLLPLLIAQVRPLDLMLLSGNAQIARFDPQSLPIWVSIGLLQEAQVHVEYLSDVVILRIRLFFELGEELLSMRPDLGRRPSSNVLFNSVPVFPEQSQRIQKSLMLLIRPATFRCLAVGVTVAGGNA